MQKNSLIQSRSGRAGPVRATALLTGRLPSIRCFQSAVILAQITGPCRRRLHRVLPWRASCARTCNVKSCSADVPRGRSGGRMFRDGPPRMVARPTWSGRERSSHSRYLPVPRVGLVTPRFCSTSFCSESLGFFCVSLFAVTVCRGWPGLAFPCDHRFAARKIRCRAGGSSRGRSDGTTACMARAALLRAHILSCEPALLIQFCNDLSSTRSQMAP